MRIPPLSKHEMTSQGRPMSMSSVGYRRQGEGAMITSGSFVEPVQEGSGRAGCVTVVEP